MAADPARSTLSDTHDAPRFPDDSAAVVAGRLALGFFILAGFTYVLIVLGALVRAHGAGLSCPDWPLCFGEVIPRFDFKVAFEWGHRALAGSIGIVFAALSALTLRRPELRAVMGSRIAIAAFVLAVQIVLGGLTVLHLLASWTVTSHLVTGNVFALALVLLGRRLVRITKRPDPTSRDTTPLQRRVITASAVLLGIQLVLGGLVSSNYAGLTCPDWPTCMNGEYFPSWTGVQGLHVFHRLVGYSVVLAVAAAAWLARAQPALRGWLATAALLAGLQVCVGVANVLLRLPVEITGLHSALAAALVCTIGVSAREAWQDPRQT